MSLPVESADLQRYIADIVRAEVEAAQHSWLVSQRVVSPLSSFIKPPKPECFNGKRDASLVENWLFTLRQYLEITLPDNRDMWVTVATTYLRDAALVWWRVLSSDPHRLAHVQSSFDSFCSEVRSHFIPSSAVKLARDELAALRQTKTVQEYANAFQSICLQIPGISVDEQVDRFVRGLKERTRLEVELREPKTLEEAVVVAVRYDSVMFKGTPASSFDTVSSAPEPVPMEIGSVLSRRTNQNERTYLLKAGLCFHCKKQGHVARMCPEKSKNEMSSH
eukprot:GILJ01013045.1.p1 GENE.GILJ01013045.1~~GILJ01013045.1.p1  ORF type:complete len:278 (-),score=40.37 GILJ01013045.1:1722-2555(-)